MTSGCSVRPTRDGARCGPRGWRRRQERCTPPASSAEAASPAAAAVEAAVEAVEGEARCRRRRCPGSSVCLVGGASPVPSAARDVARRRARGGPTTSTTFTSSRCDSTRPTSVPRGTAPRVAAAALLHSRRRRPRAAAGRRGREGRGGACGARPSCTGLSPRHAPAPPPFRHAREGCWCWAASTRRAPWAPRHRAPPPQRRDFTSWSCRRRHARPPGPPPPPLAAVAIMLLLVARRTRTRAPPRPRWPRRPIGWSRRSRRRTCPRPVQPWPVQRPTARRRARRRSCSGALPIRRASCRRPRGR